MDGFSIGPPSSFALAVEGIVCFAIFEWLRRRAERGRSQAAANEGSQAAFHAQSDVLPIPTEANPYASPGIPAWRRAA